MRVYLCIALFFIVITCTSFAFGFPDKMRVILNLGGPIELNIPRSEKYPNLIEFYQFNSSKPLCLLPGCEVYQRVLEVTFTEKGVTFTGTIFATINNNTIHREAKAIDVNSVSRYTGSFGDYEETGELLNRTFTTRGTIDFVGLFENGTEWKNTYAFNTSQLNFFNNKYVIDAYFQPPP